MPQMLLERGARKKAVFFFVNRPPSSRFGPNLLGEMSSLLRHR
jgi:hypothetical protein